MIRRVEKRFDFNRIAQSVTSLTALQKFPGRWSNRRTSGRMWRYGIERNMMTTLCRAADFHCSETGLHLVVDLLAHCPPRNWINGVPLSDVSIAVASSQGDRLRAYCLPVSGRLARFSRAYDQVTTLARGREPLLAPSARALQRARYQAPTHRCRDSHKSGLPLQAV